MTTSISRLFRLTGKGPFIFLLVGEELESPLASLSVFTLGDDLRGFRVELDRHARDPCVVNELLHFCLQQSQHLLFRCLGLAVAVSVPMSKPGWKPSFHLTQPQSDLAKVNG